MQSAGGKKLKRYYFRRFGFMLEDKDLKMDEPEDRDEDEIPEYKNSASINPVAVY